MALTVIVTRDVQDRFRGFLASAMLEVAPGVYASPALSAGSRERIWSVLEDWYAQSGGRGSITLVYGDAKAAGRTAVRLLGSPPRQPVSIDGALLMARR